MHNNVKESEKTVHHLQYCDKERKNRKSDGGENGGDGERERERGGVRGRERGRGTRGREIWGRLVVPVAASIVLTARGKALLQRTIRSPSPENYRKSC